MFNEIIRTLSEPDNFRQNWYGYATNQLSHMMLGFIYTCMSSAVYFSYFGEFAEKQALWGFIAVTYMAFELGRQKWQGWDTIEDWMFFALYGGGVPVLVFSETTNGSPLLSVSIEWVIPTCTIISAHLFAGIVARIISSARRG